MFITLEGIEGSSKTTQAALISKWLTKNGIPHILTKEPGTVMSKECQDIRKVLLSPENDISSRTELFLYLADRAQHVEKVIKPALAEGKWIISDRYSWSTYVYQGFGRKLLEDPRVCFNEMLTFAADDIWPDLTFIMDLPVDVGLARAKKSNIEFNGGDRIEREEISFHQTLRDGFLVVARGNPDRCKILNAEKSIEELHEDVKKVLQNYIK